MQNLFDARLERTRRIAQQLEDQLLPELVEKNSWIQSHIFEQKLTVGKIRSASKNVCRAFLDSDVQRVLHQHQDDLELVAGFSDEACMCLMNAWVRNCIADGYLTLQDLADITFDKTAALCNADVQELFREEENRQYIGPVVRSSDWASIALMQEWFRALIPDILALEHLADVTEGGYQAFSEGKVVLFLEKNPSYTSLFIHLSQAAANALGIDYVWDQINNGEIDIEWFVNIDWEEYDQLCGSANQNAIEPDAQIIEESLRRSEGDLFI